MKINLFVSGLSIWLIVTWFGTLEGRRVYDLTHTLDSDAPKWPVQGISPNLPAFEYFKSTTLFADYSGTAWLVHSFSCSNVCSTSELSCTGCESPQGQSFKAIRKVIMFSIIDGRSMFVRVFHEEYFVVNDR